MYKRVMILSASAGAGHLKAADALRSAFAQRGITELSHIDALKYTSPMVRNIYSRGYIDLVNRAPKVLGLLYDNADIPWKDEKQRLVFDRLNTLPLVRMIEKEQPDLVVCTHFLPAEIISWLICKGRLDSRHAITVTDFDMHAMWLCRHFDDYFVALPETREHMSQLGVPADCIKVSGIPIDPVFAQHKDKREMKAKYGLSQHKPAILLSAGGFGVGPVDEILQSLIAGLMHEVEILILCGRNHELKNKLDKLSSRTAESNVRIIPVPYTNDIDEYMASSDLLLGKPGGLTSSEALAKSLPMLIVNPIPGQEERNADHLLEEGVAIRCNNLPTLAFKIDRLLDDKQKLQDMKEKSLSIAHPNAALEIVDNLLSSEKSKNINLIGKHKCHSFPARFAKRLAGTGQLI